MKRWKESRHHVKRPSQQAIKHNSTTSRFQIIISEFDFFFSFYLENIFRWLWPQEHALWILPRIYVTPWIYTYLNQEHYYMYNWCPFLCIYSQFSLSMFVKAIFDQLFNPFRMRQMNRADIPKQTIEAMTTAHESVSIIYTNRLESE